MNSSTDLDPELELHLSEADIDFVNELARHCGQMAISLRDGVTIKEKSGPDDPVTSADEELSRLIVKELSERFPGDLVISEEDKSHPEIVESDRVWLIDPIDGTKNYIKRNGQYSVMIGLLVDKRPVYGFVCEAEYDRLYFGGPGHGAYISREGGKAESLSCSNDLEANDRARLIMGNRDRNKNPWVEQLENVDLIKTGSIGLKIARILEGEADVMVHLSGRLKTWDTAGPAAIALGGNLEVGTLDAPELCFPLPNLVHEEEVIMGRNGCLSWCKTRLVRPDSKETGGS